MEPLCSPSLQVHQTALQKRSTLVFLRSGALAPRTAPRMAGVHRRDQSDPRRIKSDRRGSIRTSAIARTICIRMSGTEDDLARDVDAPTSAFDVLERTALPATHFLGDGVGGLVVR
jgi:hypothetical protein